MDTFSQPPDTLQIWRPHEGPQRRFVASGDREILFGGAAGGGKSDGLLMAAAMEHRNRYHRGIIFRKTFPELKDLIERSREIYPHLGAWYKSASRDWYFPSGARVEFGYMAKDEDRYKYKRAWNFIGFDELTHWRNDVCYRFLLGRLRSVVGTGVKLRVRSTTNPGGIGHQWVRDRFKIDGEGSATKFYDYETRTWRMFIPSRIVDNPSLAGTSYEIDLNALPEMTRKMLRDGRWDIIAGAMFSEFDHRRHCIDPFAIDPEWPVWRGADDGYSAPACVLWFTKSGEGRIYVIKELYRDGMTAERMAEEVMKRDKQIELRGNPVNVFNDRLLSGAIDSSAFNEVGIKAAGSEDGDDQPRAGTPSGTGRGQVMNKKGCRWQPAQKGPGSRIAGVNLIHSMLSEPLRDGKPKVQIFRSCEGLIRTLPVLPRNEPEKGNPEDINTDAEDHPYDAFRYGLQYRTQVVNTVKILGV